MITTDELYAVFRLYLAADATLVGYIPQPIMQDRQKQATAGQTYATMRLDQTGTRFSSGMGFCDYRLTITTYLAVADDDKRALIQGRLSFLLDGKRDEIAAYVPVGGHGVYRVSPDTSNQRVDARMRNAADLTVLSQAWLVRTFYLR